MLFEHCSICYKYLVLLHQQKDIEQAEKTFESAMKTQQVRQEMNCMYIT